MKKERIVLPEKRYEKAPKEDMSFSVNLQEKKRLLTNDDRDIVLNVAKLFDQERQSSIKYKIYGKIKMIFRNMYSGTTNYTPLNASMYILDDSTSYNFYGYLPYNEFAFIRQDVLRQVPIKPEIEYDLTSFDGFNLTLSGNTEHTTITALNASKFNWNIYLSYAYSQDYNFPMMYTLSGGTTPLNFVSSNGIPFRVVDNTPYYKLVSPVEHGMKQGEYIIINNYPYYINNVGDENYNSDKYVVNILKSQVEEGIDVFDNEIITAKRCIDKNDLSGTTSEYYVHKLKTLTDVDEYILDKSGFESSIWSDEKKLVFEDINGDNNILVERNRMESLLFDIKEPFILSGLTNNLGYLPTDVYISVIFRNGNGYFEYPPKVGYRFNFHDTWIDDYFSGNSSQETSLSGTTFYREDDGNSYLFTSGNTLPVGTELTGAFIEYNPIEMKERVVSESMYKFYNLPNIFDYGQTDDTETFTGATIDNPFGYFYQPHYRVKLRELSPYVETSDVFNIENLPQNAKYFDKDKIWKWRDLYKHGYIDDLNNGTNYPFINNIHYVKKDINFYLKNEEVYQNKKDMLADFNSSDKINC